MMLKEWLARRRARGEARWFKDGWEWAQEVLDTNGLDEAAEIIEGYTAFKTDAFDQGARECLSNAICREMQA